MMKALTKEQFIKKLDKRSDYLTGENYHSAASFLGDIAKAIKNKSEEEWKDVVVLAVLNVGDD